MTPLPRGECAVCSADVALRTNGLVREHKGRSGVCDGSGQLPSAPLTEHPRRSPLAALDEVIKRGAIVQGRATTPHRVVPLELLEQLQDELEGIYSPQPLEHVSTVIDNVERDLLDVLGTLDDVEVLALMRFAVILDRGVPFLACAGAPRPANITRMGDDTRLALANGLRAVANVLDPTARTDGRKPGELICGALDGRSCAAPDCRCPRVPA